MSDILQKLCKWRSVFAGWQLGTRPDSDPECRAVRDHREATILLRAEVTALATLLVAKGVFTMAEFVAALDQEATLLDQDYTRRFPGFESTDHGIAITDVQRARETTKGWRP